MKKVLVVSPNWLGDVIFASPVFKVLKESYPNAQISCLAVSRVRGVLECVPSLHQVLEFDETFLGRIRMLVKLRKEKFDVAFLLRPSKSRSLLLKWAGVPVRVGYGQKNKKQFLTREVEKKTERLHRSDEYLGVLEGFGLKVKSRECCLKADAIARNEVWDVLVSKELGRNKKFVVVNPGGNWDLKRWPPSKWACLNEGLIRSRKTVIVSGAEKDKDLAQSIVSQVQGIPPIVLTGELSLKQLIAFFEMAELVVSADSGPLHIASAVGTKVVGIFGPTRPEITGPRGRGESSVFQVEVGCNAEPCYFLECPDNICMKAVSVEEILNGI